MNDNKFFINLFMISTILWSPSGITNLWNALPIAMRSEVKLVLKENVKIVFYNRLKCIWHEKQV